MNKMLKMRRYYILRLVGILYNIAAVLTVIVAVGALGYEIADYPNQSALTRDINLHISRMVTVLVVGALLAFTFAVLAQLINLLIATNENTRQAVEHIERQTKILEILQAGQTAQAGLASQVAQRASAARPSATSIPVQQPPPTPKP